MQPGPTCFGRRVLPVGTHWAMFHSEIVRKRNAPVRALTTLSIDAGRVESGARLGYKLSPLLIPTCGTLPYPA